MSKKTQPKSQSKVERLNTTGIIDRYPDLNRGELKQLKDFLDEMQEHEPNLPIEYFTNWSKAKVKKWLKQVPKQASTPVNDDQRIYAQLSSDQAATIKMLMVNLTALNTQVSELATIVQDNLKAEAQAEKRHYDRTNELIARTKELATMLQKEVESRLQFESDVFKGFEHVDSDRATKAKVDTLAAALECHKEELKAFKDSIKPIAIKDSQYETWPIIPAGPTPEGLEEERKHKQGNVTSPARKYPLTPKECESQEINEHYIRLNPYYKGGIDPIPDQHRTSPNDVK